MQFPGLYPNEDMLSPSTRAALYHLERKALADGLAERATTPAARATATPAAPETPASMIPLSPAPKRQLLASVRVTPRRWRLLGLRVAFALALVGCFALVAGLSLAVWESSLSAFPALVICSLMALALVPCALGLWVGYDALAWRALAVRVRLDFAASETA